MSRKGVIARRWSVTRSLRSARQSASGSSSQSSSIVGKAQALQSSHHQPGAKTSSPQAHRAEVGSMPSAASSRGTVQRSATYSRRARQFGAADPGARHRRIGRAELDADSSAGRAGRRRAPSCRRRETGRAPCRPPGSRRGCTARSAPAGRSQNARHETAPSRSSRPTACCAMCRSSFSAVPMPPLRAADAIGSALSSSETAANRTVQLWLFDRLAVVVIAGRFGQQEQVFVRRRAAVAHRLRHRVRLCPDDVPAQIPAVGLQREGQRQGMPTRSFDLTPEG